MNYDIVIVAAVAANGVIGHKNKLLWHMPADMRRFVRLTTGRNVVMGRKTHEAIGKVLPNRNNFVISRDPDYRTPFEGDIFVTSVREMLALSTTQTVVVIGGEQIYREFLPYAKVLHLTNLHAPFVGDAYFPELNALEWRHTNSEHFTPDAQHHCAFDFDTYWRK